MLNAIFYFIFSVLFIVGVVLLLWVTDRMPARAERENNRIHDPEIAEPITLKPQIDNQKCLGCGICIEACPQKGILSMRSGKAILADYNRCLGHGACFQSCPFKAITLSMGKYKRGIDLPHLNEDFQTVTRGIFIAGELGGMGLIRNASEQTILAVNNIMRSMKGNHSAEFDLIIVGAGTAGLSAALTAKMHNLKFIVLEEYSVEQSITNHPLNRVSGTTYLDLPLAGKIILRNASKVQLKEMWHNLILKYRIPVQENCRVISVTPLNGSFKLLSSEKQYFTSKFVLLTTGRREGQEKPGKLNQQFYGASEARKTRIYAEELL